MKKFKIFYILFILVIVLFLSFNMDVYAENNVYTFDYTGNYQEFIVPKNGYYKVELWGAQGGNWATSPRVGGYGGYTSGEIFLEKGTKLYVYVGQENTGTNGTSWNGGTASSGGSAGGGATDIRLVANADWKNFESLKTRIMVAAGGGSAGGYTSSETKKAVPGAGGGLTGKNGGCTNPGTQTSGGPDQWGSGYAGGFGYSGNGEAGGGGYYGGGACVSVKGSGGGSSFISGHQGCNAISSLSSKTSIAHTGQPNHYSGYVFTNTKMIDGDGYPWTTAISSTYTGMPTHSGTGVMKGNTGNGYAKISLLIASSVKSVKVDNAEVVEIDKNNYNVFIDAEELDTNVNVEFMNKIDAVFGTGSVKLVSDTVHEVIVIEDGNISIINLNIKQKPFDVSIGFKELSFQFDKKVYEYNLSLDSKYKDLTLDIAVSNGVTYQIKNNTNLKMGVNKVLVELTNGTKTITYTFNIDRIEIKPTNLDKTFEYTGQYQTYTVAQDGYYKIELWGAQGGNYYYTTNRPDGFGGYTAGTIYLTKGTNLYFYVGQENQGPNGTSWNGGTATASGTSGGGATDVRLVPTSGVKVWKEFGSLKSRIMVAAGGGSGYGSGAKPGAGGGLTGKLGISVNPGTQTSGGTNIYNDGNNNIGGFGYTGNGEAGGGGYYGGGSGWSAQGSSGGSSFISGHNGCDAIDASSSSFTNIIHTGQSVHYSGYKFLNTTMIDGDGYPWTNVISSTYTGMPNVLGNGTMKGNKGNGHAKITFISANEDIDISLKSLKLNNGEIPLDFDPDVFSYNINLPSDVTSLDVEAIANSIDAKVTGNGVTKLLTGKNTINITVTSPLGNTNIYTINAQREASGTATLDGIKLNGVLYENFQEDLRDYEIEIPYNYGLVYVEGILSNSNATISGEGIHILENNEVTANLLVVSEDKSNTELYTLHFTKQKTTLLESATLKEITTTLKLDKNFNHKVKAPLTVHALSIDVVPYYTGVNIEIVGNKYLGEKTKTITITSSLDGLQSSVYTIELEYNANEVKYVYDYPYTGAPQTFTAPATGYYDVELWGGQGGNGYSGKQVGGYGGYTKGTIYLEKDQILYVYVGENRGKANYTTFNGGTSNAGGYAGAGATDVRLANGTWSNFDSLKTRIMVAAGGGSGYGPSAKGGAAGGLSGYPGGINNPGTQTKGGAKGWTSGNTGQFGIGGNGEGGGGGYYGGGSGWSAQGSGGGSSFISGHPGCNAIAGTSTASNIVHTGQPVHYSDMYFSNSVMIDGMGYYWVYNKQGLMLMPKPSGGYYPSGTGHVGNGYARISSADLIPNDNYLDSLTLIDNNNSAIDFGFESWNLNYDINLTNEQTKLDISAVPKDLLATVTGTGTIEIPPNDSSHEITVTAQDGSVRVYTLNINREPSNDPTPNDIKVNRMTPSLCKLNSSYCIYTFDVDTYKYDITLPFTLKEVEVLPVLKSKYQTLVYKTIDSNGEVEVQNSNGVFSITGDTTIIVEITSEDDARVSRYEYNFTKDVTGDNYLKDIIITNPDVEVNFARDTYEYYLTLPKGYSSYDVQAIPEREENTKVTITGNTNLKVGMNDCIITVTAENGNRKTYLIHMYKEYEANVMLKNLTIDNNGTNLELSPVFDSKLNNYTLNVDASVKTININAIPDDSSAVVSGTGSKTLKSGVNTLDIIVTQGDVTNTYTVVINKALDDNPNVKNITIDGFTLDQPFNKDVTEYYIYIDKDVNKLNIDVTMESSSAKYTIRGDSNLGKTVNEIIITGIAENKTYKVYKIYAMKSISDNNYLASLTTSEGTLTPAFDKDTDKYSIVVDPTINKLEINATAEDSGAIVKGTGTYYLGVGINTIEVIVTSESGKIKTYTIEVTKAQNNDVTLKEVKNNQGSEVIKQEDTTLGYDYLINVQYEVNSIEITGIPNASTSTITGNKTYSLKTGDNNITLTVIAEDGSTKSYIVRVVRDKSNNDDLDFLYVEEGGLSPSFNETVILYDVKVPNETNILHIEAITEDKNATYEVIGGTKLDNGKYTYDISSFVVDTPQFIEVVVTAENGIDKKTYTLSVTKQQTTTDNLALLDLIVKQGENNLDLTPIFNPDTLNYELTVENDVSEVQVSATALDNNVQVIGEGTKTLNVGKNGISIFVIGESGVQKDYQIVITRKKSSDATLSSLVVKGSILNPKFSSNIDAYTLKTSANNLDFTTIKPTEVEATYEVIGNENFVTGDNTVTIRVTAPDGETTKDYTLIVTKEGSKNNNLASLEVVGYTLTPVFHKGVTFYTVEVNNDVNSILINGTAEDVNATISGTGVKTVTTGENYFDIVVTSESGTTKTYTILVTKEASDNNYLASLTSSDGIWDKNFDKLVNDYTITVPNEVDSIELFGSLEDANATSTGLNIHNLVVGDNKLEVIVTSESGKINVYTINVIREAMISAYLNNLEVEDYSLDPEFNKEIFEYYITVNNEVTSLNLNYTPEDSNATVIVTGNENFVVGMNEVHILVTASDNNLTEDYVLYVNRQMSTNNYLASLYVNEGALSPDFEKETLNYKVTVPSNVTNIDVSASVEDETAKITSGTGNHNLNPGLNTILVKVRSSIGVTRTYKIEVTREESTNKELADLVLKTLDNDIIVSNPIFNSAILDYEYTLDSTLEYIKIEAFKGDTYQSIVGDGVKELKPGVNKFEVVVTAQNGDINTYTLTINNPLDINNYLSSLIPSVGTLNPEFDKDVLSYTLDLENEVNTLSFTVTTESNKATVTGHEIKGVDEGTSIRNIVVTAEDGTEKTYVITINKATASDTRLSSLTIDNYPFEFDSDTFTYNIAVSNSKKVLLESEITAIPKDSEAIVNMMGDLNLTDGIVNIYTIEVIAKDGYTTQQYTLNVTRDSSEYTIRSNIYEILRFEDEANEDYVIGIQPSTVISDFKNNFENDPLDLKVYLDTNEVQETDLTATALILKLEMNNHVYDTLRVIVRGDLTKDGKVNITDQVKMINYVGRTTTFDKYQMLAGDLTFDGKVNITDQVKIINYVGRTISDLNNKPTS